jgi:hypothetical protein
MFFFKLSSSVASDISRNSYPVKCYLAVPLLPLFASSQHFLKCFCETYIQGTHMYLLVCFCPSACFVPKTT